MVHLKNIVQQDAFNFKGPEYSERTRENDITIIHGASGTGKMFFVAKGLPKMYEEQMQVTIYAKMSIHTSILKDLERLEKST